MKTSTFLINTLAPAIASADWWNGAPECAQSCLSSAWSGPSGTTTSWWPQQSEYCNEDKGNEVGGCITDACSSTLTAYTSYSSLSSSLCSRYASCTDAGSTGVQTITYPGGPVTWATPGGWGGKGFGGGAGHGGSDQWGGPNGSDYSQYWSDWASAYSGSKTWTGGVVTVTGCAFDGSPWFVGPNCGWNGLGGFNGFVGWGSGWSWGPTQTQTVTVTKTDDNGQQTTQTGVGTVVVAVSGTLTTSSLVGALAQETGSSSEPNAAPRLAGPGGAEGSVVTVFMGLGLGAVVAVAGML
ncbi:hypothetical protein SAMD00023353_3100110 [Rosellinia necatrix]|uniref:Uncharacterized protein n=1 Tax=Rosellinia necatrix TaxID=77044 RepID=A0A1W2TWH2_ROSNE|nr:hypothetical protein SAMD00023353_3100110 [Rosellinia necatrix]